MESSSLDALSDERIDDLLQCSPEELYLELGRESLGDKAVPHSLNSLIEKGKGVFVDFQKQVRPTICGPSGIAHQLPDISNKVLVGAILKDVLASNVGKAGVGAAIYVAVLIVQIGLAQYCHGYTSEQ